MRILVTGPQGSGKTTQAELISNKLNLPLIDIGQMLRDFSKGDSDQAKQVKETMSKGVLSPDQIAAKLFKDRVESEDCKDGFVADGYPRSASQLALFDPKYDVVFYLQIDDAIVRQRLLRRGRADDNPEIIDQRLKNYHSLTEPLLIEFEQKGILSVTQADDSIENIHQKVMKIIESKVSSDGQQ